MRLSYPEVAHRLRMTINLVKWFARYALKHDGRKLVVGTDQRIDETEVASFAAHLWAPWENKNPGNEIQRELERESRGKCGFCRDPSDVREVAHIDRLGLELKHHCQHPHNLISLCPNCHSRYDNIKTLDNKAIKHAKAQLISGLMEDVDRDVLMQQEIQRLVLVDVPSALIAGGRQAKIIPLAFVQGLTSHVESVVTGSTAVAPLSQEEARGRLASLSGSISDQSPITANLLLKYSTSIEHERIPRGKIPIEELVDDEIVEGKCFRCGELTAMESASCTDCGEDPGIHEHVTGSGDGTFELGDIDHRGNVEPVLCEGCGSDRFHVEFESTCDWCMHMADKLNDD